jgi:DNA repair exonuclease SbcCD nuclease subunit
LDYLALGHIHKGDRLLSGSTLCAWPGCPMGRGFDELDAKGVLIVTLDEGGCHSRFLPLDTPRFFDLSCQPGDDARSAVADLLPAVGGTDFYRITLTGESAGVDLPGLYAALSRFPNLELRDRTVPETDIWGNAGEDTLEGLYFGLLKQQLDGADEETAQALTLAARISRQILDNQEVAL